VNDVYKIGIISDTRLVSPDQELPGKIAEVFAGVDLIIHAGNICKEFVLEELEKIAPVEAVLGSLDDLVDFSRELPTSKILDTNGFKIGIYNQRPDLESLASERINILVSGNTCVPKILESETVPLMLDPGSPMVPSKHGRGTVILLKIDKLVFSYVLKV